MKRIHITPLWMSLAVALSPVVQANEDPAQKGPQPAPPADAQKAAEIAIPTDALAGLQKRFETMNQAINQARTETTDVASQRDAAKKEAQAVREAKQQLEGQLADLKKQLEGSNHEVWQWKDKADVLEKKLGAGEQAFQKLAAFRDQMDASMKEFAGLKAGLAEVRGELQAPAERMALKKELAELNASKDEVAKKLDAETKANAEGKRLLAASEGLAKELKKAFEELKTSAKAQFEALTKTQQERDALAKNLTAANEQLFAARQETAGVKDAKTAVEKNLETARNELTATRDTLAMLQQESSQLRANLKPLAVEIQTAKDQAALATAAIQEANAGRKKAEQARTEMEGQLKEVTGKLASAIEAQSGLQQQVESKSTEIAGLRKKVEEMEAKTANQPPAEGNKGESASR